MRRITVVTGLLILAVAGVCSGQSKVGTTAAGFLKFINSSRAAGIAASGVAMAGHDNWLANPACLGLPTGGDEIRLSLTLPVSDTFSFTSEYSHLYATYSGAIGGREQTSFYLGVAPYYNRMKSPEVEARTYTPDSGKTFSYTYKTLGLAAGFGWSGPVQVAVGYGIRYIREDVGGIGFDGVAFDLGAAFRWPIRLKSSQNVWIMPGAGMSWLGFGPDFGLAGNEYPLADSRRGGVALTLMSTREDHPSSAINWSLTGTVEYENLPATYPSDLTRLAFAFTYARAISVRFGHYFEESYLWDAAYGYTLDSGGLIRLLSGHKLSDPSGFWQRFSLSFSQAVIRGESDDTLVDIAVGYLL
jgi:hypothetical protein